MFDDKNVLKPDKVVVTWKSRPGKFYPKPFGRVRLHQTLGLFLSWQDIVQNLGKSNSVLYLKYPGCKETHVRRRPRRVHQ